MVGHETTIATSTSSHFDHERKKFISNFELIVMKTRALRAVDKNTLDSPVIPGRQDCASKSHVSGATSNSARANRRYPDTVTEDDCKLKEYSAKNCKRVNNLKSESAGYQCTGQDKTSNLLSALGKDSKTEDLDAKLLAREEATLLERAAQLERDRKCLNERKYRAYLQKLEEDLNEEAEKEMQAFQDALQTDVETQILEMMHEKEVQLAACASLRGRLLEQCQQLQQLLERCTVKAGEYISKLLRFSEIHEARCD